ncbi:ribosome assembly cofactor RimP [Mesonia aquimarina]|uniref:ribosome assembly cofactor RimP n=1 Tax=Mesonia aquimarina TaxID=1504967 RepID=UPI000EF5E231|nr:ribosome assembly cofactor RimP [Mesonia aquimarina]
MQQEKIKELIEQALAEKPTLFLIDFEIKQNNQILVIIDDDKGVSVHDCIDVSRKIEHNLDRDEEDFSLEVTSAGVSTPLRLPRQFKKNIGRKLAVKTETDSYEAKLEKADENEVLLKWKAREPKPVGKGKVTVKKEAVLPYNDIVEAKVMITF